jgi:hypothetical protein
VNGDQGAVNLLLERAFDAVTNIVRVRDRHLTWDDKVEVDERDPPGVTRP